jgi:outer membrane immunogenic protein
MKAVLVATSLLVGFSCASAMAADIYTSEAHSEAPLTDWSGFSIGAIGSYASGEDDWSGDDYELDDSFFGGGYVSYQRQFGNLVVGAEARALLGEQIEIDYPSFAYEGFYDLNAKVGFSTSSALVYTSGGVTWADIEEDGVDYNRQGYNVGAGVDFKVTENVYFGGEYTFRTLGADCEPHGDPFKLTHHSVSLKIGYVLNE